MSNKPIMIRIFGRERVIQILKSGVVTIHSGMWNPDSISVPGWVVDIIHTYENGEIGNGMELHEVLKHMDK